MKVRRLGNGLKFAFTLALTLSGCHRRQEAGAASPSRQAPEEKSIETVHDVIDAAEAAGFSIDRGLCYDPTRIEETPPGKIPEVDEYLPVQAASLNEASGYPKEDSNRVNVCTIPPVLGKKQGQVKFRIEF